MKSTTTGVNHSFRSLVTDVYVEIHCRNSTIRLKQQLLYWFAVSSCTFSLQCIEKYVYGNKFKTFDNPPF